jgi:hypothetical protein
MEVREVPFVMYDEVLNKKEKVISITGVMVITDSERPEKIYPNYVDEYGNKRDKWMKLEEFINKYGSDLLPALTRLNNT